MPTAYLDLSAGPVCWSVARRPGLFVYQLLTPTPGALDSRGPEQPFNPELPYKLELRSPAHPLNSQEKPNGSSEGLRALTETPFDSKIYSQAPSLDQGLDELKEQPLPTPGGVLPAQESPPRTNNSTNGQTPLPDLALPRLDNLDERSPHPGVCDKSYCEQVFRSVTELLVETDRQIAASNGQSRNPGEPLSETPPSSLLWDKAPCSGGYGPPHTMNPSLPGFDVRPGASPTRCPPNPRGATHTPYHQVLGFQGGLPSSGRPGFPNLRPPPAGPSQSRSTPLYALPPAHRLVDLPILQERPVLLPQHQQQPTAPTVPLQCQDQSAVPSRCQHPVGELPAGTLPEVVDVGNFPKRPPEAKGHCSPAGHTESGGSQAGPSGHSSSRVPPAQFASARSPHSSPPTVEETPGAQLATPPLTKEYLRGSCGRPYRFIEANPSARKRSLSPSADRRISLPPSQRKPSPQARGQPPSSRQKIPHPPDFEFKKPTIPASQYKKQPSPLGQAFKNPISQPSVALVSRPYVVSVSQFDGNLIALPHQNLAGQPYQNPYENPVSPPYQPPVIQPYHNLVSRPYGNLVIQPYVIPVSQPNENPGCPPYGNPVITLNGTPYSQSYGNPVIAFHNPYSQPPRAPSRTVGQPRIRAPRIRFTTPMLAPFQKDPTDRLQRAEEYPVFWGGLCFTCGEIGTHSTENCPAIILLQEGGAQRPVLGSTGH